MEIDSRLVVLGTAAVISSDEAAAFSIDEGNHLALWQNDSIADLWVDRFDARLLLSSVDSASVSGDDSHGESAAHTQEEEELVYERYCDLLDSDESELCSQEESSLSIQQHRDTLAFPDGISFPSDINLPTQLKHFNMLMHTAKCTRDKPQLEVLLRVKQVSNPNFDFLLPHHYLFDFYQVLLLGVNCY